MAQIKDPNEQDQGTGQLGSQAVGSISGGGAGNPAAGATAAPQAKGSGNFVNLSRYMTANEGNEAVGNSVNDIDKTGQGAQDQFANAKSGFDSLKVDAPKDLSQGNQDYLANFNPKSFSYTKDATGRGTSAELDDISKNMAGTQYRGPSESDIGASYGGLAKAAGGLGSAQQTFAASPDGAALRKQSLTDTNSQRAAGNYGAGAANLDSLLTEKQGQPVFDARRQALGQMASSYDPNAAAARTTSLTQQAQLAQGITDKANNTYKPAFQNIQNTLNNAAHYSGYGVAGGGGGAANGEIAKPMFGAATDASRAAANRPAPAAPTAAPRPASNATPYDAEDARNSRKQ